MMQWIRSLIKGRNDSIEPGFRCWARMKCYWSERKVNTVINEVHFLINNTVRRNRLFSKWYWRCVQALSLCSLKFESLLKSDDFASFLLKSGIETMEIIRVSAGLECKIYAAIIVMRLWEF